MIRYTLFSLSLFLFFFLIFYTASNNIGTSFPSVFSCQELESHSYIVSSSLHRCSFGLYSFFPFFLFLYLFLFFFLFFFLQYFPSLLCLFLSSPLYFYLLLLLTFLFNVNTFKLYPSKQTSLNNIVSTFMVYSRPAFIYLVHSILRTLLFFFTYIQQPSRLVWVLHFRNI